MCRSKNITRVRNCPDVAILSSLFGLCLSSFCLFVVLPSSLLSFCLFVFLSFCLFVFLSFCLYVFLSRHHSDEMSEGLEVSKVTICVKILKWHPVTDSLTKVRYRAASAAKNHQHDSNTIDIKLLSSMNVIIIILARVNFSRHPSLGGDDSISIELNS